MADLDAIRLLVLDVDGVMTDGRIFYDAHGREMLAFHVRDGLAIKACQRVGVEVAIVTGRANPAIAHRARDLGVRHVMQRADEKWPAVRRVIELAGATAEQTALLADDLADLPSLKRVGYPMAVADAAEEVKAASKFVTTRRGGDAAVREAVEHLLKRQGRWDQVLERYQ